MRSVRAGLAGVAALAALCLVAGCSTAAPDDADTAASPRSPVGPPVLDDAVTRPLVEALPEVTSAAPAMTRLAPGLVPPTSSWFSGLVLAEQAQPIFPLPLSFALTPAGVEFGVPTATTRPGAIVAPHLPAIALDAGTETAVVTRYDEVSLTIALSAGDDTRAEALIARGSPVVGYRALAAHDVRLSVAVEPTPALGDAVYTVSTESAVFALVAPAGSVSDDGRSITLAADTTVTWVAMPIDATLEQQQRLIALAASPVERVTVSAEADDDEVSTTLEYVTADEGETVVGRLPHQSDGAECDLGSFATVYGAMRLCAGPELSWAVPAVAPSGALDLEAAALTPAERGELVDALAGDVAATTASPGDTYFGGKALGRLASLLQLARQLAAGDDEPADRATEIAAGLESRLADELREWTEPQGCADRAERCVGYDPVLRGIVGQAPSFGSEEFNDHHFHYGYFLYAAAVLVGATGQQGDEIDAALVAELRPVIDLLAADLASSGGELFATSRAFDPYSGHSWASGFAPFADGNNQESSSEAVSAANGLALWAHATDDSALAEQSRWMLASEAHSARTYYTDFDRAAEPYAGFERGVVGIVWDAKRDYGTWFSAEPAAILGIQLLPMHPVSGYLGGDADRIRGNLAEAVPAGPATAPLFADALLMYQSLAGGEQAQRALEAARTLPVAAIDAGGSQAYLLAYIMSRR